VPSVAYVNDALAAFFDAGLRDGLIVSSSASSTVVMPVLDGVAHLNCTKRRVSSLAITKADNLDRLSWGGAPAADYMLKLLQIKYPAFSSKLTFAQAADLVHTHAYLSPDYAADMARLQHPTAVADLDRVIQAPYSIKTAAEEKTEEEVAELAERRRQQMRNMQELAAKQRAEKVRRSGQICSRADELSSSRKSRRTWCPCRT
jgi:actin-related protein 5